MSEIIWYKHYYDEESDDRLRCETPYIDTMGTIHGVEKWYYKNGKLMHELTYYKGELHGVESIYYYEDGVITERAYHIHGRHVTEGEWKEHELITQLAEIDE